jgi:hypothetical protein
VVVLVALGVAAGPSAVQAIAAGASRLDQQLHQLTQCWQPWPWPDPQRRPLGVPVPGKAADCCLPFVLYTDLTIGRGHLLYRRYDARPDLAAPATWAPA